MQNQSNREITFVTPTENRGESKVKLRYISDHW